MKFEVLKRSKERKTRKGKLDFTCIIHKLKITSENYPFARTTLSCDEGLNVNYAIIPKNACIFRV